MENNMTLQSAADLIKAAVPYLASVLVGKPESNTGAIRLTDRKGRHCATVTIADGVPSSVAEVRIGQQNLLGSVAKIGIKSALGM
jgi:hypothetical protein